MNIVEVNRDAMSAAILAVVGQTTYDLISRIFDAIDLAERRGHADGFDVGFEHGSEGFADARFEDGRTAGYHAGYDEGHEDGCDEGYEKARRDLGECPTVAQEFDYEYTGWGGPLVHVCNFVDGA
jgi:hypothetical protein